MLNWFCFDYIVALFPLVHQDVVTHTHTYYMSVDEYSPLPHEYIGSLYLLNRKNPEKKNDLLHDITFIPSDSSAGGGKCTQCISLSIAFSTKSSYTHGRVIVNAARLNPFKGSVYVNDWWKKYEAWKFPISSFFCGIILLTLRKRKALTSCYGQKWNRYKESFVIDVWHVLV